MEAQKRCSRKRKQPPSSSPQSTNSNNPFVGILTRCKSQKFFFHHSRSGNSRKCRAFPSSLINPNLPKNENSRNFKNSLEKEDEDEGEIDGMMIKDLRARRVFSKPPNSEGVIKSSRCLTGKNANPNLDSMLVGSKLDGSDCKCAENGVFRGEGLTLGNPNLELVEKGCNEENPNLSMVDKYVESRVNVENPNLSLLEKSVESRVAFEDIKSTSEKILSSIGNPILLNMDLCVDSRVEYTGECFNGGNPNLLILKECDGTKVDCGNIDSIGKSPDLSMLEKCVDSKSECSIGVNPNFSKEGFLVKDDCKDRVFDDMMSPNLSCKEVRSRSGEDCEENVQTTPPDAIVLVRQNDDPSVSQSRSADSSLPSKKISPIKGGSADGKRDFPNSRRNMGLLPCSRMKVFKAPNSFSYRRLLPFLMDIAKDDPNAPKVHSSIKVESQIEEKPQMSSQECVADFPKMDEKPPENTVSSNSLEINIDSKEEETHYSGLKTDDSSAEQAANNTPINCPLEKSQNPVSSENQMGTPGSDESLTETPESFDNQIGTIVSDDSYNGAASSDGKTSSDNIGKLEGIIPIAEPGLSAAFNSPKKSPEHSVEDVTERKCKAAHHEFKSELSLMNVLNSSFKTDDNVSSGVLDFGHAKSILKKNPRGCRGVCGCLNCASFRLNAEKAFEFSRNQLLDAEELAMNLMKELTSLRCILENSVNGANAILTVDQVQKICTRVSTAENSAKSQLSQMNEDLYVHCRTKSLNRPRVNFSSSVQKKIME